MAGKFGLKRVPAVCEAVFGQIIQPVGCSLTTCIPDLSNEDFRMLLYLSCLVVFLKPQTLTSVLCEGKRGPGLW